MKLLLTAVIAASVLLISFNARNKSIKTISSSAELAVDVLPGSSPYLTKDNKGNTVLSWVRQLNDSSALLCYSILDGTNKTIEIPTSSNIHAHAENLPKVIFKSSGDIIAIWGARNPNAENKYSGLIFYSQCFDDGKTWTTAQKLVNDDKGYDQRYSDVSVMKNGEVAMIWLDNRKTQDVEGSALYFAVTDGRKGFTNEVLVSQPACQCCRTSIFVDNNDHIHALYRGIINDSIRDMIHVVSTDGGKTFSRPERIFKDNWVLRGCPHTGPSMTENSEGLHFAWYSGGQNKGSFYIHSTDNGNTFIRHDSISSRGMHPQMKSMPNDKLVIVWDESVNVGKNFNKRIGLQVRSNDGRREIDNFITLPTGYNTYPVIKPVNENELIVAYTSKKEYGEYVMWQRVKLGT
jgi:hypothetical protein